MGNGMTEYATEERIITGAGVQVNPTTGLLRMARAVDNGTAELIGFAAEELPPGEHVFVEGALGRVYRRPRLSRDALLAEIRRSVEATHPGVRAEQILRELEHRLPVEKQPTRLADGTVPMIGLRVRKVRAVLEEWGRPHAWDDRVHVITGLRFVDHGTIDIGPEQCGAAALIAA